MKSYHTIMEASRRKSCTKRRRQYSKMQWVKKGEGWKVALNLGSR